MLNFCKKGVTDGLAVGAYAMESLLWVKVPRSTADALLADRLTAEQLMKVWMKGWKQETGLKAVTIYVEWGDVEIARGETTLLSGVKTTIRPITPSPGPSMRRGSQAFSCSRKK